MMRDALSIFCVTLAFILFVVGVFAVNGIVIVVAMLLICAGHLIQKFRS